LRWLGSARGQQALASQGVAFPAAVAAQETFVDYWAERGVDVTVFIEAAQEPTIAAPLGPNANAGANAIVPILQEMFLGRIPVPEALEEAQAAGNEAIAD
ncbi:sugar ABC transporter substrate-binding protein, partial [Georgenia sp. 10Sc9-8]|nr:sugar ABC transporter substrate-binding protein [Georgenia halotolerans]